MTAAKSRIPSAGKPRRRRPEIVGIRGSSQPRTWPFVDEAKEDPLRQDRVGEVEPRELVLPRSRRHRQVLDEPVVERPVDLELERADRVGDALDGVRLAVREVVRRVDAPGVAGAWMLGVHDPVQDRVAQVDVRGGHVDPGAQDTRAVGELAVAHPLEQVEVLVGRSIAPRAVPTRLGERAAVLADLVGRQVVDVRVARSGSDRRPTRRAARSSRTRSRGARPSRSPSQCMSAWMESMYSCSSLAGLVSSKRRWQRPPNSRATPKLRQIDLA